MKLFSRKTARGQSARPALSHMLTGFMTMARGGESVPYDQQLRESFLGNAIAARAVRMVAEAAGTAPLKASDPTLLALVQNASAGQRLVETLAAQLLLHGNGYVQIICGEGEQPSELYALRPERVSVDIDARGWPMAYCYRVGNQTMRLDAEDVRGRPAILHLKQYHPCDDHYGAGCLSAIHQAIAAHNAATRWNRALLDNAARPSGVLVHDPGDKGLPLSDEQYERLKEGLNDGFSGTQNAGRPLLLEGGLKWQSLSMSPAEMDFLALKESAAREIAAGFGVPPMLLGLPGDATYANYREANRALWRQTVLPLCARILDGIAQGLGGWFDAPHVAIDLDHVSALAEERERLWAQVKDADFLTNEEKRHMLGF